MSVLVFEQVPAGVEVVKTYRALKCSLVHCRHHPSHRFMAWGRPACRLCKADESMTDGFQVPVKLLAEVKGDVGQGSLFQ